MSSPRISLLGVPVDALTRQQILHVLLASLKEEAFHHIITVNNEMLVKAQKDDYFFDLLQRTTLNTPDSTGLKIAARFTKQELPEKVPGVDMVQDLCNVLDESQSVFLLGASEGTAEKAAETLKNMNPKLKISGAMSGSPHDIDSGFICRHIAATDTTILLVAFGAPRQDVWIDTHHKEMPNLRLAIGVGGTFDFLAGNIARAPERVQKWGLEWLWRFMKEPSRYRRMWNATVVFLFYVFHYKKNRVPKHGKK